MNKTELLAHYNRDQRREIEFPGMTREAFPNLVRFTRPKPGMSFILYSDLVEDEVDPTIEAQINYFSALHRPFDWKTYTHDRPANMAQRLIDRGFEPEEEDAIMVLDVASAPDSLLRPPAVNIRRLTDPEQLSDVVSILTSVWDENFDWVYDRLGSHMVIPGYLSVFLAYVGETPASAGWTYYNPGLFAGLWGGSTLADYRGRGLYKALLAARVQEARLRGVPFLTVDAGAMSRPIVEKLGFEVMTHATSCEWKDSSEPEELVSEDALA